MPNRFDALLNGADNDFLMTHGLFEMTEEETLLQQELMDSAVPFSLIWKDRGDAPKVIKWDAEFERYLEHRIKLIDHGGRESFAPWAIYEEMGLQYSGGYGLDQAQLGSCAMCSHRNATTINDLVNAKLLGVKPVELNPSIAYAAARGNGKLAWGSGANLGPLSSYTAKEGNHLVSDVGPYNIAGKGVTEANRQQFRANALKHQSIICHLPNINFDTFQFIGLAGLAANVGTNSWCSGGQTDTNGMQIGTGRANGGHAITKGGFAITIAGTDYVWFQNQHGLRYKTGTRIKSHSSGCFMTRSNWGTLSINPKFGVPYICITELGHLNALR